MKFLSPSRLAMGIAAFSAFTLAGCGRQASQDDRLQVAEAGHADHGHGHEGHHDEAEPIHGGWWCYEHGVPEEECAMCDTKLAAELREQGDWCDEHNRPDSLCFECHPENAAKYVALYEAKYGKEPPQPTD